ncbi:MAG TPA: cysteine--tRNA ligase [Candidatus Kapabacteria bacterium]|nr:cysteine--tRNA ligase [Candidatus Kapabacteria bacterium]
MPLEIYNTLTRRKEIFTPLVSGEVGMYVCGPTVYSDSHVGHAKSYITFDVVRRYLEFSGYHVTYVQNITDVGHLVGDAEEGEDKLQERSKREMKHPMEIAEMYTTRYYEDMDRLQIRRPDIAPRATGHIIEQIEIITQLIDKGAAYEVDGNVYFDVSSDQDYGKLSGRKSEDQESSGRVDTRSDKRNPQDFALWKRAERGHIMRWPSPWGVGFPGWHIECSAMAMKYLGETIDIHGGGLENQFPHHECEIAQSETATGKDFVRYWMHNNMVTVDGKKMGKSLGNSSYLRDLYQEYAPLTLRFTILQSHYRSTTEFKPEAIIAADTGYQKLLAAYAKLSEKVGKATPRELNETERSSEIVKQFVQEMDEDFNTPKALAVLYDLARDTNNAMTEGKSTSDLESLWHIWNALAGDVLGILPGKSGGSSNGNADVSDRLMKLIISWRKEARENKDFAMADTIRKELAAVGVVLEDGKEGTTWKVE